MRIKQINHFSIRTEKVSETVHFYCDVLGLKDGFRPPFKFPGAWLYIENQPIVHILDISDEDNNLNAYLGKRQKSAGTGSVDHIALECKDYSGFHRKLSLLGLEFQERFPPETEQRQLFVEDPNGITIELIFLDPE